VCSAVELFGQFFADYYACMEGADGEVFDDVGVVCKCLGKLDTVLLLNEIVLTTPVVPLCPLFAPGICQFLLYLHRARLTNQQ
jgi:hypothetical protein